MGDDIWTSVIIVEKEAYLWNANSYCPLEGLNQTGPSILRKKEYVSIEICQKSRNLMEHRKLKKWFTDTANLKRFTR